MFFWKLSSVELKKKARNSYLVTNYLKISRRTSLKSIEYEFLTRTKKGEGELDYNKRFRDDLIYVEIRFSCNSKKSLAVQFSSKLHIGLASFRNLTYVLC